MDQVAVGRVAQDLKRIAQDGAAAERQDDTAFMERTLTDDFMAIGPRNCVLNKEQGKLAILIAANTCKSSKPVDLRAPG
jgi:hypothetical protein